MYFQNKYLFAIACYTVAWLHICRVSHSLLRGKRKKKKKWLFYGCGEAVLANDEREKKKKLCEDRNYFYEFLEK